MSSCEWRGGGGGTWGRGWVGGCVQVKSFQAGFSELEEEPSVQGHEVFALWSGSPSPDTYM
jgi:hypothetical protein